MVSCHVQDGGEHDQANAESVEEDGDGEDDAHFFRGQRAGQGKGQEHGDHDSSRGDNDPT